VKKETHHLRCEFSEEELKDFSKVLARETQSLATAEEEKKVATAQFAERIARHKASTSQMSRNINNGYEMRMVQCEVLLDKPIRGTARIVRLDTGEVVKERVMTPEEMQMELIEKP
jgi:hypothetical protein